MPAKPFVLAVKAVILDERGRCLLIRRSPHNRSFVGSWEWPGGKVDAGEDYATAVVREAREETALDVEITGLAGAMQFEMPKVSVVLLCMEVRQLGGSLKLSEEHDDAAWVALEDFSKWEITEHTKAFMLEYATKRRSLP